MILLVLGGEKSGKSGLAYERFREAPGPGTVLAMGLARDEAFRRQILAHRLERDPAFPVTEPGAELPSALEAQRTGGRKVLVDSLDFWLFTCMEDGRIRTGELLEALEGYRAPDAPLCALVSCEVGLGPIAPSSLARRFAREQGALNQALAALAQEALLVVAGLPLRLK
ncbi:Bifunctional adenosylcobalamin biosynthesis protein CobP [Fundidesulfovibrio magnetotacticus]|uniref:Adenosylcobinamide kinase n=1 Tax=Fundidesulfovibrio magnetotacticus TaxID=2730080 RepID=A0A6V8LSI3_9BACT|nr:bifunctional adenosylcobinamide kinase/adenosylcobinamide-phosphate guanylyltransferase [Fundidesulfovibrio magnetotacticus]GFK93531.1 Bifunctional adenosylcobalamin biosynthesis protein CobP [Fundidesulfovibrio magnetotacticus]